MTKNQVKTEAPANGDVNAGVSSANENLPATVKEASSLVPKNLKADLFYSKEQMAAFLKNLDADRKVEITATYLTPEDQFEGGEARRFVFTGFSSVTAMEGQGDENGKVKAITLFGDDEKPYIAASSLLVGACENLPLNTAIEITYLGKSRSKNGFKYDNFTVEKFV